MKTPKQTVQPDEAAAWCTQALFEFIWATAVLLPFYAAHSSTCVAVLYKLKGIHKHPQFSLLEFHRSPCKRQILTSWDGGCSSVWKQPPRASSCSGSPCYGREGKGRLARAVLGGGHKEPPGNSQVGSTHSNFYDCHGRESFRVFSRRCPFSSPFLLTSLYVLLPSALFIFISNAYPRYSYLFFLVDIWQ